MLIQLMCERLFLTCFFYNINAIIMKVYTHIGIETGINTLICKKCTPHHNLLFKFIIKQIKFFYIVFCTKAPNFTNTSFDSFYSDNSNKKSKECCVQGCLKSFFFSSNTFRNSA